MDERLERLGLDYIGLLLLHHTAAYDDQDPENPRWIGTMKIND